VCKSLCFVFLSFLCDNLLLQKCVQSLCEITVFLCVNLIDPLESILHEIWCVFFSIRPFLRYIIFLKEHFIIYLLINNFIVNYKKIYNLFALKNSKNFIKMLKIAKSKKLWGSVKTKRSIFVKNQSQFFPSHIVGFRNKK